MIDFLERLLAWIPAIADLVAKLIAFLKEIG